MNENKTININEQINIRKKYIIEKINQFKYFSPKEKTTFIEMISKIDTVVSLEK